jgi:hypothetical protein
MNLPELAASFPPYPEPCKLVRIAEADSDFAKNFRDDIEPTVENRGLLWLDLVYLCSSRIWEGGNIIGYRWRLAELAFERWHLAKSLVSMVRNLDRKIAQKFKDQKFFLKNTDLNFYAEVID